MEHFKGHTQFTQQNFIQLGKYDNVYSQSKSSTTTLVHKNGIVGQGCPYAHEPMMYILEFCKDDFVQKTF